MRGARAGAWRGRIERALKARPPGATSDYDLNPSAARFAPDSLRDAAVLVPVVERAHGATVILTRRTDHLPSHAGQIAFPGGKVDPEDTDAVDAALREAEEEVGLARAHVEVAGLLDFYVTGTGFRVTPVLGFVDPGVRLVPNPHEVAEVFEAPLDFLMNPRNHERHARDWQGERREYYAMPWQGYYIWGATAGMLRGLALRVAETETAGAGEAQGA
ncbi:MAG: CoA pyrophosphatase [Alphaproteobacteria bacterium]|nr:CoA pyrophosphatase [Alphaproteobacteria bacterium]MDX5463924.1 CoA pyrophosphatase [Alphaproteobacteria bacterium]